MKIIVIVCSQKYVEVNNKMVMKLMNYFVISVRVFMGFILLMIDFMNYLINCILLYFVSNYYYYSFSLYIYLISSFLLYYYYYLLQIHY